MSRRICSPTALFTERQNAAHALGAWRDRVQRMGWVGIGNGNGDGNGNGNGNGDSQRHHGTGHTLKAPHGC